MEEFEPYQKFIKEAKAIVLIIVSVLIIRSVFFEPFRIPSGSMIPTLKIGDFILVNKFAYGFKIPFSDIALGEKINLNPVYLFGEKKPERGDVVVFKFPQDPTTNYIKRVIGLPGDIIEVKNKIVYVNNVPITMKEMDGSFLQSDMDDQFKNYKFKFYNSKIGNHEHIIQLNSENYYSVNFQKTVVPQGKYFMMGDNRDHSYDSRSWGYVPFENIKGKAIMIWFSFIFPFGENKLKFRPSRIGYLIN